MRALTHIEKVWVAVWALGWVAVATFIVANIWKTVMGA